MIMNRKTKVTFKGAYTAIITPFDRQGKVDYPCFKELIERQIRGGIAGIMPVGTTGESPTLDMTEHSRVIDFASETVRGRIQVVAGTGANSTHEALELTRNAKAGGATATLQVTPYYNRPSPEGLYRHFSAVADVGLPVVLYNVPSRTAREIPVETAVRLSKHPLIAAIKESGGNVDRVTNLLNACSLTVLAGDDSMALPMMAVGAKGVVSVASNLIPKEIAKMTRLALSGDIAAALKIHRRCFRLFTDLFIDTNPVPVKAALAMMNLAEEVYRLPLCPTTPEVKARVRACLKELKLI
jgi:4-hydroxy-tetrahydrodipicolinate synthase